MSEKPTLQIDDDWKRQAQEEKKRLAEEAKAAAPKAATPAASSTATTSRKRGVPEAGFGALVQSFATQALYYLGELAMRGGEPMVDLDMAKYQLDLLTVLEEKTRGNLSEEEQGLIDSTLYETRMRYVSVATQMIR
jgi:hypothetical protein